MFSNFGYSRRPTTITTYKRKRNDPLPATLSDDDSDLDEPILSTNTITRSSPSVKLGNNISYDTFSTATSIQHPISTFLDKQLEINKRNITFEEELPPQQQQLEITQALQPQQSINIALSSPTIQPVVQSSSVAEYQERSTSSFSAPTIENNSSTLDMASVNLLETSQHVQQQYQLFDTSFQIPSQSLPSILDTPFDWMTLGSTFGQNVAALPSAPDPLSLLQPQAQQQQQQQEFRPASNNGSAISTIAPMPIGCNDSFIPIQPTPQSVVDIDTLSNITINNIYTNKENNVTSNVHLSLEPSFSSSPSSSPSSFDIFKIPEIPTPSISPRFVEKQSSQSNSNTPFDVFDFPLENNVPKVTKKYQSPTKQPLIIATPAATSAAPETVKKNANQTQFDIFDFPEDDDTNILELKMISTPPPSLSSSSFPAKNNNERDKNPLKRNVSQANSAYTIPKEPLRPRQHQHQQKRKPLSLKKSKSDTPSSSGRRVRFAPEILISTFYRTSLDRSQPFSAPTFSEETVKETEECSFSVPSSQQQQQQQLPIKRKRNLVSKLRGATGAVSMQSSNCPSLRKYNFDDDEDEDDRGGEEETMVETTKMMDEDDEEYRQRMQRELVAIMQNEFGQEDEQEKEGNQGQENISSRPQYQPKNPMNVRVTYKSSKRHHHLQQDGERQQGQDREMIELDNLLDKLRAGGTDL
ncbi:hypothetical protein INT45_013223 [Circinella minor]|uniref:Uncharacterized protein n=1 Tax=Circinella minor TaxID=1195481 RepID=A0A8H7VM09_9FUNG|nr:hypothetical protein INT45_013223 [Circinella minor]